MRLQAAWMSCSCLYESSCGRNGGAPGKEAGTSLKKKSGGGGLGAKNGERESVCVRVYECAHARARIPSYMSGARWKRYRTKAQKGASSWGRLSRHCDVAPLPVPLLSTQLTFLPLGTYIDGLVLGGRGGGKACRLRAARRRRLGAMERRALGGIGWIGRVPRLRGLCGLWLGRGQVCWRRGEEV